MPRTTRHAEDDPQLLAVSAPSTLTGEHALLLDEVTARAADLLAEADQDRWPQGELQYLLDYLHLEVLRQVVDEEWLLFRNAHNDSQKVSQLRQDHQELRRVIEGLANSAASAGQQSPHQLAATIRDLLTKLRTHIGAEEQALGADAESPSTSALGRTSHTWYEFTDGPIIDLDNLPGPQGVDAVLGRLLRLRVDEQVDLRASSDPLPIWRQLAMADPGGYGFSYLQQGPPQWRVQITRRPVT
jgi:uncharacterized protein (DUF2249 family)/ElaB/YqjD/DUF883 family membrane-anchored ribosome-binding protein